MPVYLTRRSRRRPEVGAVPGSLRVDPEAPKPKITVFAYGPDDAVERKVPGLEMIDELRRDYPVTWVNVDGLGEETVIRKLGETFNLHPLALADTVHTTQRPKVETYEHHSYFVMRMVSLGQRLESEQVSMYLGDGFVLTFQEHEGDCLDPVRERLRRGLGRIRSLGADYLAYALLDAVIDGAFPVLEAYGERIEEMERRVITAPSSETVRWVHNAKRDLLSMRRATWPQREALSSMLRGEVPRITKDTQVYLRDCYDHITQIIDILETYRELASGLLDAYLSSVSNRMNEVMKVLTIIATIFIPLSFIAGLYGMNFDPGASPWNMPELGWRYGYPFALLVMVVAAGGMLIYFRRRGWLGGGPAPHPPDAEDE